jgi:WD40 repeat protein
VLPVTEVQEWGLAAVRMRFQWAIATLFGLFATIASAGAPDAPELVVQTGHGVGIHGLAFSPILDWAQLGFPQRKGKGEILAVGGNDGRVELWEPLASRQFRTLPMPSGQAVLGLTFDGSGSLFAAAGQTAVRVWETASGRPVTTFYAKDAKILGQNAGIAFSSDGTLIALSSSGRTYVWSLRTNQLQRAFDAPGGFVAFAGNDLLAVASPPPLKAGESVDWSKPYIVSYLNMHSGSVITKFTGDGYTLRAIAFADDGTLLGWGSSPCPTAKICETVRAWAKDGSVRVSQPPFTDVTSASACPKAGLQHLCFGPDVAADYSDREENRDPGSNKKNH